MNDYKNIIISRTDSIGDVVLTLPMIGLIKEYYPNSNIYFLGSDYTKSIIDNCVFIKEFISWNHVKSLSTEEQIEFISKYNCDVFINVFPNKIISKLAKKADIPIRIGTTHRFFHFFTCNKLLNIGRKKSNLHEAQLNIKLLEPLNINIDITLDSIKGLYGLSVNENNISENIKTIINNNISEIFFNIIIHPKSKGSAREWGIDNYKSLIELLPKEKYKIFITGTEEEGNLIRHELVNFSNVIDLTGKMTLEDFVYFISKTDALIACSTGPLHIASALGKHALGIYAPMRPIFPTRWAPIGINAKYFVKENECNKCRKNNNCECIKDINPSEIYNTIKNLNKIN